MSLLREYVKWNLQNVNKLCVNASDNVGVNVESKVMTNCDPEVNAYIFLVWQSNCVV